MKFQSDKILSVGVDLKNISSFVQDASNSAPSYNGQFGPKVKSIGSAMNSRGMQLFNDLNNKERDLKYLAEKFEERTATKEADLAKDDKIKEFSKPHKDRGGEAI